MTFSHSVVPHILKLMCCLKLSGGGIMNEESPRDTKPGNKDYVGFPLWSIPTGLLFKAQRANSLNGSN